MSALVPFNELSRMAEAMARSQLFGMKTPDQVIALMLVAQANNQHPAAAARDYDIIQGRPSKKAEAMLRDFIDAGGSVQWHALDNTKADATFRHPQGGSIRIDWDMQRATAAGLSSKDMYKKWPRQMLRARCISEGVRTIYPVATGGMYTPEEVQDIPAAPTFTVAQPALPNAQPEQGIEESRYQEIKAALDGAQSMDEMQAIWEGLTKHERHCTADLKDAAKDRLSQEAA